MFERIFAAILFFSFSVQASDLPKRWILTGANPDTLARVAKKHGAKTIKKLQFDSGLVIEAEKNQASAIAEEAQSRLDEDIVYSINGKPQAVQPAQTIPWGISRVRAGEAPTRGSGVRVCVSDTGIDLGHPDLKTNIVDSFNTISPTKSANDDNGHGSHVAGTIAALDNSIGVVGVAPQSSLIAAKGLNRQGSGYSTDLAETIDGCRLRGAQVINMSWGSSQASSVIHDAIVRAASVGIILVAAAGNSATNVGYPAAFPEVVAVSAVDSNEQLAWFSNFGPEVQHSAPGVGVLSTYKGGSYATLSGTSMAAPHVSGVAALMLSVYPSATRYELYGIDIGLPLTQQGLRGRIDAVLSTVR